MALESRTASNVASSSKFSVTEQPVLPDLKVVSQQKNAEQLELESLRQQASRLNHLLNVMPAGVIVLDAKGIVRQANEQASILLGEPLEGEMWRAIIKRSFKPRADDGHEVSLYDGRRVKLSITPLANEPGQLIVLTDLTETRQLQARVGHMQRLSSLGKMVASLAHQVRTPLSAAMLYASNLKHKHLSDDAKTQFAGKLQDRLKELESQVNDMLLFAKSGEQQVVNNISVSELYEAIAPSAEAIVHAQLQRVEYNGESIAGVTKGNLTALQGAILNLIQNASHVSPKSSTITVTFSVVSDQLNIGVSDSGPGVNEKIKAKIFEPFYTTKTHGTGLGLAVVQSVAKAHHGQVKVSNNCSSGATFSLIIPCSQQFSAASSTENQGE